MVCGVVWCVACGVRWRLILHGDRFVPAEADATPLPDPLALQRVGALDVELGREPKGGVKVSRRLCEVGQGEAEVRCVWMGLDEVRGEVGGDVGRGGESWGWGGVGVG